MIRQALQQLARDAAVMAITMIAAAGLVVTSYLFRDGERTDHGGTQRAVLEKAWAPLVTAAAKAHTTVGRGNRTFANTSNDISILEKTLGLSGLDRNYVYDIVWSADGGVFLQIFPTTEAFAVCPHPARQFTLLNTGRCPVLPAVYQVTVTAQGETRRGWLMDRTEGRS